MHTRAFIIALSCAAALPGQSAWTSPSGLLQTEGDSGHTVLFGSAYERFQQIDASWTGTPRLGLQQLSFRRDGDLASSGGGARRLDLTVRLGGADSAAITDTFDANWLAPPTVVFSRKTVDLPDWSTLAAVRPAPFDFVVPFDNRFDYGGTSALCVELRMQSPTLGTPPRVDRELGADHLAALSSRVVLGPGCIATGQSLAMTHRVEFANHGGSQLAPFGMRLATELYRGPANQAAVLNLDMAETPLTPPGLCGTVRALPTLSILLGTTDLFGDLAPRSFDIAYDASLEGASLVSQVVSLDSGQSGLPLALSDACRTVMPLAPRSSPDTAYLYAPRFFDARAAQVWRGRAMVMRFDQ